MRHGKYPFVIAFLAVPLTLYSVFVIAPYAQAFWLSTTVWNGFGEPKQVGFDNYMKMLVNDGGPFDGSNPFWQAVWNNLTLLLTLPLITVAIALFFAFLLNVAGKGKGGNMSGVWGSSFYRIVFFFPQLLAVPIIALLFQTVYRPTDTGLINGVLIKMGAHPINFLSDPDLALPSVIFVLVWQAVGFYVVLFSAGMGSIPKDLYEAAYLDGASHVQTFFKLTLPLLRDNLQVAWVYLGVTAFDAFAVVNVLTVGPGGPDGATTVLAFEIYRNAFTYSKYGLACAMGVALCILTMTFAALTFRVTKREAIEF